MLAIEDVIHNQHKSESQERINKNGCVMQCMFQKDGMMEDAEYKIEKMHIIFVQKTNVQSGDKRLESLDNCINASKDLPDKCEKAFLITECILKSEHKHKHEHDHEHHHD
ncbi:PBGP9 protein, partial [Acromyrmex insinuator]